MATSDLPSLPRPPQESLIEYPCLFPIKVMGTRVEGFTAALVSVARDFDPDFDEARLELRESRGGKQDKRGDDAGDVHGRLLVTMRIGECAAQGLSCDPRWSIANSRARVTGPTLSPATAT